MKIVVCKSDDAVTMVADCITSSFDPDLYDVHDLPGWDWSLATLGDLKMDDLDLISKIKWNGSTLVKK